VIWIKAIGMIIRTLINVSNAAFDVFIFHFALVRAAECKAMLAVAI